MAENPVSSKLIGIYVNDGTEQSPEWKLVVCATAYGFSGSTSTIDASTLCDGDNEAPLPDRRGWTFSDEGYYNSAPGASSISNDDLFEMWNTSAIKQWKMEDPEGTFLRIGKGFISQLDENGAVGDYIRYSITIQGTGPVSNVETT